MFAYQTNEEGKCKVYQSSLQVGHILLEHPDFYERNDLYGTGKVVDLRNTKDSILPLIRRPLENDIEFLIKGQSMPNFYVRHPDGTITIATSATKYPEERLAHFRLPQLKQKGVYTVFTVL